MEKLKSESMDWALWFYWIMATTLGWLFGNIFFKGIPVIISGVIIAALQWSVLFKRIQKAWRWIILSSLGWIAGYILFVIFIPSMSLLIGPVMGGAVGIMQWFVLRNEIDWAGWWVPISMLAWTTGLTLVPGALTSGSLPGALTGLTLIILFRFSERNSQK
jgi:hypothetical protein